MKLLLYWRGNIFRHSFQGFLPLVDKPALTWARSFIHNWCTWFIILYWTENGRVDHTTDLYLKWTISWSIHGLSYNPLEYLTHTKPMAHVNVWDDKLIMHVVVICLIQCIVTVEIYSKQKMVDNFLYQLYIMAAYFLWNSLYNNSVQLMIES